MRAPRYGLITASAVAAWLSVSPSALGAEPGPDTLPLHVVAIQTPDADDQAEALTKALRAAVRAMPGWSLGQGDYSLEVLALSMKCPEPPDADCQSRIADQIKTDRYVWGLLSKGQGGNVIGELNLWTRGKGTTRTTLDYSANLTEPNDESLKKVASDALMQVTGGPPKGEVRIKAGDVSGQVFVDGQPMGALTGGQGSLFIPSGSHQLTVKAPGFNDATVSVTVKPNSPSEVMVTMVPKEAETKMNWKKIGGFAGIGLGVGLGVGGLVSSLQVSGIGQEFKDNAFVKTIPKTSDACEAAKGDKTGNPDAQAAADLCGKAGTFEVLQAVFYPLAAISAGAGVYLLMTSAPSEAPKQGWVFLPKVGTEGGKLDVIYRF